MNFLFFPYTSAQLEVRVYTMLMTEHVWYYAGTINLRTRVGKKCNDGVSQHFGRAVVGFSSLQVPIPTCCAIVTEISTICFSLVCRTCRCNKT